MGAGHIASPTGEGGQVLLRSEAHRFRHARPDTDVCWQETPIVRYKIGVQRTSVEHAMSSKFPIMNNWTLHTTFSLRDTRPLLDAPTFSGIESCFSTSQFFCQYRHCHGSALRHALQRFVRLTSIAISLYVHTCCYLSALFLSVWSSFSSCGHIFVDRPVILEKKIMNAESFDDLLVQSIYMYCTEFTILGLDARTNTINILRLMCDDLSTI
jgi:hypothetical protein